VVLAQVDPAHAAPGSEVTIRLADGGLLRAVVADQLAQVDPEGVRVRG
jgi:hypothetical protein